jgi:hypothetical protein
MKLAFDEMKAIQAAALFVKLAGNSINYMALIKLLYRADREAFRRCGLPITTDEYVSMKHGPVTSTIYDRIKSSLNPNVRPTTWSVHIQRTADPYVIQLKADPGESELPSKSRSSKRFLRPTATKIRSLWRKNAIENSRNGVIPVKAPPLSISRISWPPLVYPRTKLPISKTLIDKQRAAFSLAA